MLSHDFCGLQSYGKTDGRDLRACLRGKTGFGLVERREKDSGRGNTKFEGECKPFVCVNEMSLSGLEGFCWVVVEVRL